MTKQPLAVVAAVLAGLVLTVVGQPADARTHSGPPQADSGALDIPRAQAAHPTCHKAANELISRSKSDYYMRSTAFMRIRKSRLLASNVSSTSTMPNGDQVVTTDVVRCVGRALRKGSSARTTVYYAITLAPDMVAVLLSGNIEDAAPPPPTYSITYQPGIAPAW